ncbi:MAG: hypothetical protein LAN37_06115 [Acidobacteriia bacterium]|jgi:hypothetical protein|nr:hypothetical protein [Terriglobia bacterium]
MQLVCNLNPPLRALYVLVGILLLAYALYAHLLVPGITLLLLIVVGVLFIVTGSAGH